MIDARGLSCPQPVILTQKAVKAGETTVQVMVDNICAVENITRFAKNCGYALAVEDKTGDDTLLTLTKG
ncbi:MAG: sulfurtransferase TusA family protein [Clostridiales bacterium]|jgi:TusA-related sulfurtransferase|nr:sulfurtransferase TusA family protein [Clostridiales bacterium]